jgi:hypothetical protein
MRRTAVDSRALRVRARVQVDTRRDNMVSGQVMRQALSAVRGAD